MKTNRVITMLAVAAAAMACTQAEIDNPSALKANQFTASVPGTKVSMNADFSLYWEEGDQVSVFAPDGSNNLFTSDAQTGATSTVLHGGEDFVVDPEQTYYAIYPYSADNSIEGSVITTTIPTVQTPVQGAFPVNYAVAVSNEKNLYFKNVCGLIGFNITQEDIVSVTLKSAGAQEYLTGKVAVDCADVTYDVIDGLTEVTLVTKDKFATGTYYVAVLPQTFTGMTVTMFKADGSVASVTNTAGFTLDRSSRVETGTIDGGTFAGKIMTISNAAELQGFLAAADSYSADEVVTLANDIDLSGYDLVPATKFAGTFDGNSKKLTNWNTKTALIDTVAGTVQNLIIDATCALQVQIKGDAAFIAKANTGTITGCKNYGAVTSVKEDFVADTDKVFCNRAIGTIAAVSTGSVVSCENHGTVNITPESVSKYTLQYIGGLVGIAQAPSAELNAMESCTNNGAVTFDGKYSSKVFIGGVCGSTPAGAGTFGDYGVFQTLRNTAAVTLRVSETSKVTNTYINLGGVIGYAEADLGDCDNTGTVSVILPINPSSAAHDFQRPAIAGVAGTVLYNVANCDNSGNVIVKGAFGTGDSNDVGVGYFQRAYFGGVVAFAGSSPASNTNTVCTLSGCNNTGDLDLDLYMFEEERTYAHIGGVVGNAVSNVSSCSNTGKLNVKNRMYIGFVGGVVGLLGFEDDTVKGSIASSTNNGPINYDMVNTEEVGNQSVTAYIGGVSGKMQYAHTALKTSHNNANGDITVSNGPANGNCYVGGLTGFIGKMQIQGTNSDTGRLLSQGNISVNTPKPVSVGGIVGRASHQILDVTVDNESISVINPGSGSKIGGVCGDRQSGGSGDARMKNVKTNISVSTNDPTSKIYLGCWNGLRKEEAEAFHSTEFVGSVTYSESVTFGLVAGLLDTGANIKVGAKSSQTVKIPITTTINGVQLGTKTSAELSALLFGEIKGTVSSTSFVVQ